MSARRRLVLLACACALALVPASAHAAVVQVIGLSGSANGIAVGADGNVYVVEPFAQQVTVLTPDGTVVRRVPLGATGATSAALGPDGQVWVATGSPRGFVRIAADGTAVPISTAALFGCAPVGMAAFAGRMFFTAPDTAGCGTHGLGSIGPNGEAPATAGAGTNVGFDLAASGGKLYVPMYGDDAIVRRGIAAGGAPGAIEASYPAPPGASPDGIEIAPDTSVAVTYAGLGQVAKVAPGAASGTAPTVLLGGLDAPFGLVANPDGGLYAASHADARVARIASDGTSRAIPLPAGFHPWQLATVGRDTWVTDDAAAQVARVVDDVPTARLVADASSVTAQVDPRGNDTAVALTITPAGGGAPIVRAAAPVAAGIGEQPRGFALGDLPAGDYAVTVTATNARGAAASAPVAFSVPAAPAVPLPKPAARKPTFAQVLSVASAKRCLSRRQLTLTLRKRTTGSRVTAVSVTIGKGKAKSYKGAKLKLPIKLTGLPKGTFKVRVVITLADAAKLTLTRTYKTCAARKHR